MRAHSALSLVAVAILCGCGDGVVSGDFQGDPMIVVSGLVCGEGAPEDVINPRVGILWKQRDDANRTWIVNAIAPIDEKFPTLFYMPVFDPPPEQTSQIFMTDGGEITAGLGCPVVFDDRDLDETYSAGDQILAFSWDQLILFNDPTAGDSDMHKGSQNLIGSERLIPGYQVVSGVCEPGHRSETLTPADPNQRVDISLVGSVNEERSCVSFF